jgi:oxygen-independent coproporphyrinogen-3 oxidase
VTKEELIFEFMLNTTRLEEQIDKSLFTKTTLLPYTDICLLLEKAANIGLIILSENNWQVTELGRKCTNNLQEIFLAN